MPHSAIFFLGFSSLARLDLFFNNAAKMVCKLRKIRVIASLLSICVAAVFLTSSWNYLRLQKSSYCGCNQCLTDGDPCIRERIISAPKPFLSIKNKITEDIFNWWKRLQGEKRNFTYYNEAVDTVFKVIPPFPDFAEPSPDRCKICAVVGNSANLKGSRYGPLIDFHDIVIRINRGRTKGYEADVGTKTTYHIMYPESATYLENTTRLIMFPFKSSDFLWLMKKLNPGENGAVNSKLIANKNLVAILSPEFMKYVHEAWLGNKGYYPSTGFLTFALSLFLCDEVTVFGFGADSDGNWSHYFERLGNKNLKTGAHPGGYEYDVMVQLDKKKKIRFFKGW
ncbi:CMP-N-acetylneuraminate-beta-galactosamide-alpha-2,3-sialyltransferase 1 isoform X2 [Lates calcarifer]|uniref:CMP-N-acetylneuraminate-beta-galactosamide- alpha-2,3-sialyltransferase 1 isoform X2 n=1 Tax=Lates calcarifer TaxID=8187 RepID=A0AAJ7LKV8_LATCA|nr:CMP-N-acetylneuraminate-beta-galactosamide-alpha-2,3-sialyltransferase 1-like [Lates calcarifer]XP_018556835.1 CMP-N-acetylneuraminate-beta-galactosamide-alpha-2,3-sialyltransferase 1 isoform X2 [Lates calcarifer]